MRRTLSLLVAALALLTGPRAPAQTDPGIALTSERDAVFDLATGELVFREAARLEVEDGVLTADEIRYNARQRTATARGSVAFTQGGRRLLARELVYHLDTRAYSVEDLRFGKDPIYLSGSRIEGAGEALTFHNATVTYGEPGRWAPTLKANRVTYLPERERLRAEGARLGLGLFQPLPLPSNEIPTDISFLSYLSLNGGYNSSLGVFLEAGVHVPIGAGAEVGGDLGLYSGRGILAGPSGSYLLGDDPLHQAVGAFSSGFIHDNGNRLLDILGRPVPKDRGFAAWQHRQTFGDDFSLLVDLNYWSDSEVLRDFRSRRFFPVQTPDNFVEAEHRGPNTVLAFFARAQLNPYHQVQQRLPEVTFDLLPTPLLAGIHHRFHAGAAILRDDPPAGGPTLRSDRLDGYYALTRPISPREWLTLNPVAGARVTHYARTLGERDDYTRTLGELGFDAELRASGTYAYRNERWGIDGLRHLITPRLSYRYIPQAERGRAYIPPIDRDAFSTYLQPLGLDHRRRLDELTATNTLRLALDNRLQTRDPAYGSRDLVTLNLAADLRFDEPAAARTLSDIHSELTLTPAPWLAFELYHRFRPDDSRMRELNTALLLRDGDLWTLRLANHYLEDEVREPIEEYISDFRYRFTERYAAYFRLHYDARRDRFIEQSYGVRQTLENRWIVSYELSFFEGPRRESDFGFNLLLDSIRF